jgi:NADH-quinone oxidoreductase subunit L
MLSLIVLIPFLSAALLGFVYLSAPQRAREGFYAAVGIAAPVVSALLALDAGVTLAAQAPDAVLHARLFEWISLGEFRIPVAFMADRLTAVMIAFVTVIGTLIHIYAAGYMRGDPGYGKFFAFFNFFMGSMLLLVLADNPLLMFGGWELVGLASYLLIGFYHTDSANVSAASKAFILNRVGDFGFIIGLVLLFVSLEGEGYTFEAIRAHVGMLGGTTAALIGLLLFVGAMGKSAQIPLYVWLPDAMAGPTPVSALIHAATMVTAGVYMVARFAFLYNTVPAVGEMIAIVGAASALFAAVIASYQRDIKKILAYSTISQLGYMFIAVGLGAYSSGIFHVFTHAFFKALLFMGAGAVIIALHHEQDIFKMGGLRRKMKYVYAVMLIATLTISGIPPFAAFFSKDAILAAAFASGHYGLWGIGTLTVYLTAYYMFRLFFVVFHAPGEPKRPQPLPRTMTWPLAVLAFGCVSVGLLGVNGAYGGDDLFAHFIALPDRGYHLSYSTEYLLGALNVAMGLAGIGVAYLRFAKHAQAQRPDSLWHRAVLRKFYVDELYAGLFVRPLLWLSRFAETVVDRRVFDGFLGLNVWAYRLSGRYFSLLQNGKVRFYALYILAGVAVISSVMLRLLEAR